MGAPPTSFEGASPRLAGFDQFYAREIEPWLTAREEARRKAASTALLRWGAAGVLAVGGVVGLVTFFVQPDRGSSAEWQPFAYFGAIMAAFGLWTWGDRPLRGIREELKTELCGRVVRFFGFTYAPSPSPTLFQAVLGASILPSFDRSQIEDGVSGTSEGVGFEIMEAHLEDKRTTTDSRGRTTTRYVTVFRGLIGRFAVSKSFKGRTLILQDGGLIGNLLGGAFRGRERVLLEDPQFEKMFEVYADDQVEARYLLTPSFMERLVALAKLLGGKLQVALVDQTLYLAVNGTRNRFEGGSLFEPLTAPDRIRSLVSETAVIQDIVETLKLNQDTRA